ncbi:MAG: UDP-N-acetylmuramate dehydrogenase [Gallionella sp.]|jgi:UDP-N-acetylmuramate dehydrogenase|nr:UDP-N-acetylmuramate dehydrogenase [Gallionella sp.]
MNMSEILQFTDGPLRGELRHRVAMSKHTSWRAGGVAERTYQPADLADLQTFLRGLPADEPLYVVGLGSNLLVRDGGLRGTVVLLHGALKALRMMDANTLHVEAGVPGAKLARFAAAHHLSGAAFFAGIPGTLGGMLAMNAGCYGSETWQHVTDVQVLTRGGELLERGVGEYEIGYREVRKAGCRTRDSGYSPTHRAEFSAESCILNPESLEELFVSATLHFANGDGEIERKAIKELLGKRIASQPLNLPNAGSVFRNPVGDHAARLIESCGLKGKRIGGAQVSQKHANFIVNAGDATAADIEDLIVEVRATVAAQTGVVLHPEVRIIGEVV